MLGFGIVMPGVCPVVATVGPVTGLAKAARPAPVPPAGLPGRCTRLKSQLEPLGLRALKPARSVWVAARSRWTGRGEAAAVDRVDQVMAVSSNQSIFPHPAKRERVTPMSRQLPSGLPGKARGRKGRWLFRAGTGAVLFTVLALTRALLGLLFGAFKRSEVYAEAIARATSAPEVRRELGEPVRAGWWVSGHLSVAGPSGEARFATPLYGPEGKATLSAHARKARGRWDFDVLEVAVEGRIEPIRLLG